MSKGGTMSVQEVFLKTLEELGDDEFENFKWFLQNRVEWSQLETADRLDTVDKIIQSYNQQSAEAVKKILEKIHRNDLVMKLSRTRTGAQEAPLRSPVVKASKDAPKTNTSLNHDDIISKSDRILKGPPAVYHLKPEKQTAGSVRRLTLGEKNVNKINKTILLVGETGAGKSTLINALVNYAMGVKWEDNVWFQIVEDEKRTQSESQTSDVIVYQIFGFEDKPLPYSLTIINTPGYGSTSEIEQDDIISQRLFDLFRSDDGVHEIDAVGLVLKATQNRVSDRLRYIFDSVMSLFGKDMEEKIVALITHSNGLTPDNVLKALEDANIKIAKDEDNEPVHFLFDNCQKTERTKKSNMALKNAWNLTMDQISQLTDFLQKRPPQNLRATVEVLNSRIRLTACIQNLQERVEFIESKQKEIKQTQEASKKEKYDKSKADCERTTSLLENLKKTMEERQREKDQLLDKLVVKLDQIALNVDSVSTHVHFDFLIERMKEKGDKEKVQKLEEMKSRVDEGTRAALRYKLRAAGKTFGLKKN